MKIALIALLCGLFFADVTNAGPPMLAPSGRGGSYERPPCPQGWTDFKNPIIGMEAYVPGDYWVRLRGGVMLTVEKQTSPATMAFMMPFRPRGGPGRRHR